MLISNQADTKSKVKKQNNFILILFSLYFILTPFYLWKSGLPQISDFVMLLLVLINLANKNKKIYVSAHEKHSVIISFLFVYYIVMINIIWVLITGEYTFIKMSLFYIYNAIVFVTIIDIVNQYKHELLKFTLIGIVGAVLIQLFLFVIGIGNDYGGGRYILSFNNPNQLGYFAILILSIIVFVSYHISIKNIWYLLCILGPGVLVILSLSNAAIISYFGMLVGILISKNRRKVNKRYLTIVILAILLITVLLYTNTSIFHGNSLFQSFEQRLSKTSDKIAQTSDVRGYYRITEYPQYWIFGSGEGAFYRFRGSSLEFHSTLGNLQVSYGIIGLILFLALMIRAIVSNGYKGWYLLFFIMLYGLTHNGIRNSLLWILIALMSASQSLKSNDITNVKKIGV